MQKVLKVFSYVVLVLMAADPLCKLHRHQVLVRHRRLGRRNEQTANTTLSRSGRRRSRRSYSWADRRQSPAISQADQRAEHHAAGHPRQGCLAQYNCINCHTLFGEGAYYAPDLTKIAQQRGAQYLQAYLRDPSKFYDEQRHRRLMPKQDMSDSEITDLIAFLDWVSKVDNQGWPPRPILVTGATIPGTDMTLRSRHAAAAAKSCAAARRASGAGDEDPMALGERLFRTATPACNACHSVAPGVNMAGPSLAGVATRAQQIVASPDYKGKAKDVAGYISESIVDAERAPRSRRDVLGERRVLHAEHLRQDLTPEQVDAARVAYLG